VQNRRFTKEKRYFLSPTVGILINDSFTKGQSFGLSGGYYMNEQNGVEVSYLHYNVENSKTTDEIFGLNGAPAYNKLTRQLTATYNWMPIYGKVSLFDKSIIYFDMGLNVGLGLTTYEKQLEDGDQEKNAITFIADISQQFFIKESLAIRFDIRNRFYKEEREKYRNSTGTLDDFEHSLSTAIGIVYYFGSSSNSDK
jgi:outer membrane beta-barrel protein